MRAADVPEYVQDGVVDCGITGADLVRERGAERRRAAQARVRRVHARGRCADRVAGRADRRDLAGARVATVFPAARAELLRTVSIELVDVTGSVELAPRLGLADAIVDLVSSGSTLRTNGLRSVARCSSPRPS